MSMISPFYRPLSNYFVQGVGGGRASTEFVCFNSFNSLLRKKIPRSKLYFLLGFSLAYIYRNKFKLLEVPVFLLQQMKLITLPISTITTARTMPMTIGLLSPYGCRLLGLSKLHAIYLMIILLRIVYTNIFVFIFTQD